MQEICAYSCHTNDVHTPCLQKQLKQSMDCLTGLIEATVLDNPTTALAEQYMLLCIHTYGVCCVNHNPFAD